MSKDTYCKVMACNSWLKNSACLATVCGFQYAIFAQRLNVLEANGAPRLPFLVLAALFVWLRAIRLVDLAIEYNSARSFLFQVLAY